MVGKGVHQPAAINLKRQRRRQVFARDLHGFFRRLGLNLLEKLLHKLPVVGGLERERAGRAAGELEQFVDHVRQSAHLLADQHFRFAPMFRSGAFAGREFCREADDVQRVFEIVDDGLGKAAHQRKALGLQHLLDKAPIELPHPKRELPHQ